MANFREFSSVVSVASENCENMSHSCAISFLEAAQKHTPQPSANHTRMGLAIGNSCCRVLVNTSVSPKVLGHVTFDMWVLGSPSLA